MKLTEDVLGKRVIARWGTGGAKARGTVVAFTGQPTATIEMDDGTQFSWIGELVELEPEPPLTRSEILKILAEAMEEYSKR